MTSSFNLPLTLNPPTKTKNNLYIDGYLHLYTGTLPHNKELAWGIDPGVNFGVAYIEEKRILIWQGALENHPEPGYTGAIAYSFLQDLIASYSQLGARLVVEGAAYAKQYGQVKLEEIRQSFYMAGYHSSLIRQVQIVGPKTIRQVVFKNGEQDAHEIWNNLNHNAAAALSMALYVLEQNK